MKKELCTPSAVENQTAREHMNFAEIEEELFKLKDTGSGRMDLRILGSSGEGRPLYAAVIGKGAKRIWIQARIHGHEPCGGEAALKVLRTLILGGESVQKVLKEVTFFIVPVYNPDGSEAFTRVEVVNKIDLARDFNISYDTWLKQRSIGTHKDYDSYTRFQAKETRAYYQAWLDFKPHYMVDIHQMITRFRGDSDDLMHFAVGIPCHSVHLTDEQRDACRQLVMVAADATEALDYCNSGIYSDVDDVTAIDASQMLGAPGPGYPGKTWEGEWLDCIKALEKGEECKKAGSFEEIPAPGPEQAAADGYILTPGWRNTASIFFEISFSNEKPHPQLQTYEQRIEQTVVALWAFIDAVVTEDYKKVNPDKYYEYPRPGKKVTD